jgi:putative ABC transport system ATP-binding protein
VAIGRDAPDLGGTAASRKPVEVGFLNQSCSNVGAHGSSIAELIGVTKAYDSGPAKVMALSGVSLSVPAAGFMVVLGPSGSGKSTLLNLLGCLDTPTSGRIEIAGRDIQAMSDVERSRLRAQSIGFVFQDFRLIPVLTAIENVEYALRLTTRDRRERSRRADAALVSVGLGHLQNRYPAQLSGGQQQRVAIARAIVKRPVIVLADEPTANVDRACAVELIALMRTMQRELGTTFVFSSHDTQLIVDADQQVRLCDGMITDYTSHQLSRQEGFVHEHA